MFIFCSCSKNKGGDSKEEINITYELLSFNFTPQTDTEGERLMYQIKFINNSNINVSGVPKVYTLIDGFSTSKIIDQCRNISSHNSCTINVDITDENPSISPNSIEFISAEYILD